MTDAADGMNRKINAPSRIRLERSPDGMKLAVKGRLFGPVDAWVEVDLDGDAQIWLYQTLHKFLKAESGVAESWAPNLAGAAAWLRENVTRFDGKCRRVMERALELLEVRQ